MSLPPEFISNVQSVVQEDGRRYVDALPDLVAAASAQWNLTNVQPVPNLSYNFVAFANRGESQVILKVGLPNRETLSEMAALHLFDGKGACKLLEYDENRYWMLLEKLNPGVMLAEMEDDEEATHIAAEVMKKMWQPMESGSLLPNSQKQASVFHKFIKLTDWFLGGFERLRKHFNGGTGPLNEKLVKRVEDSVKNFFAENHQPVLMHGDFHHYNILSSERGWLVIDPKGVIGPACYEVGPFMLNPWGKLSDGISRPLLLRRIDILHEHLGFERERIIKWSLAHAILSAWWSIEDNTDWKYAADFANLISTVK